MSADIDSITNTNKELNIEQENTQEIYPKNFMNSINLRSIETGWLESTFIFFSLHLREYMLYSSIV